MSSDTVLALKSDGSTVLPRLYLCSQHFPRAMSGCELRGQSVGPLSWHLPDPVLAWSKWQCCRPAEMQVSAAVTPPVQLMATWSGQGGKRQDGGEGRCLHVTQRCAGWQNSPLGKGLTSQAIRGSITQPQHTEHWVMAQLEKYRGGDERQCVSYKTRKCD